MKKETYIKELKTKGLDNFYEYKLKAMEEHKLEQLFLEVTSRCNARCEHCGSSCGESMPKDEISKECLINALEDIAAHYNAEDIHINVTGGEPLMRKDLFDIMARAIELGFYSWGMTTNGMLITDKTIEEFERTKMRSISISLDGMKETHESFRKVKGSFDTIVNNLKKLKEWQQKTGTLKSLMVTTVANKKNLHEIDDIYNLLVELEIPEWRLVTVDPIGRAKKNDEILLDKEGFTYVLNYIKEKNRDRNNKVKIAYGCSHFTGLNFEKVVRGYYFICATGYNIGSILSNGDIFVCPNVPRVPELIQGNIKTDSFSEVWDNKYKQFRDINRTKSKKCENCKHWKYCLGDSFHTFNYLDKEQNICMKNYLSSKNLTNIEE